MELKLPLEQHFLLQSAVLDGQWGDQHVRELLPHQSAQIVEVYVFPRDTRLFFVARDIRLDLVKHKVTAEEAALYYLVVRDLDAYLFE